MLDLLLIVTLGFLGSFGHCAGMCGPLTAAFALSQKSPQPAQWQHSLRFHGLLNLGRILSYTLVGAAIGGLGSVLVAGGQLAGIESPLRRGIAIFTGLLLIWFGLAQILPTTLPKLPLLHPLAQGKWHDRLSRAMVTLSLSERWWTPALLGLVWGLVPCGFLYAAQIKAAETQSLTQGAVTMLAFGLGTTPMMLGVGVSTSVLSCDRRSQLFRLGGWVSLTIGLLTLLRSSEMVDYTGHLALGLLMLALVARPLSRVLPWLLTYRRAIGVGAFVFSVAHTAHMIDHSFEWNVEALSFLPQPQQASIWLGAIALCLMIPAALTSFDRLVVKLGRYWRWIHLLTVPALVLAVVHTVLIGSHYLGNPEWTIANQVTAGLLGVFTISVLLARSRQVWSLLSLEKFYGSSR
jgi:uncharacterized protein